MTVIAAFNVQGCPVVFGDLLTTAETEPGDRIVAVPAIGDVRDFFEGSGWTVTGLAQKGNHKPILRCGLGWFMDSSEACDFSTEGYGFG
jgi:hypothetical protein